jgi:hypothetical protein
VLLCGIVRQNIKYSVGGAKSLVMGSNGTIYRALTVNTNQNPTTTVGTHWEIAFANTGDFYTKVQSDANYLAKTQNLADLTNTATARTNLSVYSQAQTYTKTEVDAKTTVASSSQAQALVSNATLLTPLRLAEAFKGANQSLTATGFQVFPGGLILQWGRVVVPANNVPVVVTLPKAWTTAALVALAGLDDTGSNAGVFGAKPVGLNQLSITQGGTIQQGTYWIALGY